MEPNHTNDNSEKDNSLLSVFITDSARNKLETICTWSKVAAVIGFVSLGISVLSNLINFNALSYYGKFYLTSQLISMAISFFLNLFLIQFSNNLRHALNNDDQQTLTEAAAKLKAYLRMLGILFLVSTIVIVISYSLLIGRF